MLTLVLMVVGLLTLAGYYCWTVGQAERADQARRRADVRHLQYQAERRLQRVAHHALQQMLDEARQHGSS